VDSSNRLAEGFLLLFREKLGIDRHFSYKTIERGYDREPVNKILDEIVVITNENVESKEETFSFDGTGFSASNKENYARFATKTEF
jgi:transposase